MSTIQKSILEKINLDLEKNLIDNWHGIDTKNIQEHLIKPTIHKYLDPIQDCLEYQLWTVLEENPKQRDGYTIYYHPLENEFGLGMHGEGNSLIALGIYGSFIDALNAM